MTERSTVQAFEPTVEGTVELTFRDTAEPPSATVFYKARSGAHFHQIAWLPGRAFEYIHFSPGTGTRRCLAHFGTAPWSSSLFVAFTWSPDDIQLMLMRLTGPEHGDPITSLPADVVTNVRLLPDGQEFWAPPTTRGVRVEAAGNTLLVPTAIENWENVAWAVGVLTGTGSSDDYMTEVLRTNASLSMLVTGVETYTQTRFSELASEGASIDMESLFNAFSSRAERDAGLFEIIKAEANASDGSFLARVLERINFQSMDDLKKAYKKAYGIKLGELAVANGSLELVRKLMLHRHRVVHVSPILGMVRGGEEKGQPTFVNYALLGRAVSAFDGVIRALHAATLSLR